MPQIRKDSLATRRKLIRAAEQLFASHSIDDVSLADINRAAGQRNRNALHYHFGNKATLIDAVLDKHSISIDQSREEQIDALLQSPHYQLRDLLEVLVRPIAEKLNDPDGGIEFIKINAQLMSIEHYAALRMSRTEKLPQTARLLSLIRKKMPSLPAQIIHSRMLMIDCMLFQGLASYLTMQPNIEQAVFIDALIDGMTAVLAKAE